MNKNTPKTKKIKCIVIFLGGVLSIPKNIDNMRKNKW